VKKTLSYSLAGLVVLGALFVIDLSFIAGPILTPYRDLAPVGPLYSFFVPTTMRLVSLLPLVLFLVYSWYIVKGPRHSFPATLLVLFVFSVLFRVSFAMLRHDIAQMGMEFFVYPGEEFIFDAFVIEKTGLKEFLAGYAGMMPGLSLHGRHFPPGNALLLALLLKLCNNSIQGVSWALVLLSSTFVLPFASLVSSFRPLRHHLLPSVSLAIFMPTSVIYGVLSMDAFFAMLALWPVWLVCRASQQDNKAGLFFLAGVALGITLLFSFSALPLGLFLALFLLFRFAAAGDMKIVRGMFLVPAGSLALLLLLYLMSGFNMYDCFKTALMLNLDFMTEVIGAEPRQVYWYAVWGNYLAFAVGIGFPAAAFLVARFRLLHRRFWEYDPAASFAAALALALVIAGSAGIYWMETERIWMFFAFLAVIPAAETVVALQEKNSWLLPVSFTFVQTFIMESLLFSLW
jgi:hypothetical protein